MTDNTSRYAGNYPAGLKLTCILDEGAPTVGTGYDVLGQSQTVTTWASELAEGDIVAISNDTACTYAATEGAPVVEKAVNGETLIIGRIISPPRLVSQPATTGAGDSLTKRLAGKYYRQAVVEVWPFHKVVDATVVCDGTNAQVQGVATKLKFNITSGYSTHGLILDSSGSGGAGAVPLHAVPAGTNGDKYTCLVGITGLVIAETGA